MIETPSNKNIPALAVRPADLADLDVCLTLDPSYSTESVWQMDLASEDGRVAVSFRSIRLPRSMRVEYPHDRDQLVASWKRCDGFLVAHVGERLVGYVALSAHAAEGLAWVCDMVVQRASRRQGVGLALVNEANHWAKRRGLRWLVIEAQTKNYPAICFCQKNGFSFCGFNDHYYPNQDIAVFFARNLR